MNNNKLIKRIIGFTATAAMFVSGIMPATAPLIVNAQTTYETNESLSPDASSHVYSHDLTDIADEQWDFESDDVTVRSYIKWDSSSHELTIRNVDLNITNNNASTWMSYFTYDGDYTVSLYGTNKIDLTGNVCLFQSTNNGNITIKTDDVALETGELYTNMSPVAGSTTNDECHFIEAAGDLTLNGINLSVKTSGVNVNGYTNIWANGDIDIIDSFVDSEMLATSAKTSSNAIATNGNMTVDADSTLIAKCNIPDSTTPYWTVNNAILVSGSYTDAGSKLYLTNVNGHVLNAGSINITAASGMIAVPVYTLDGDGDPTTTVDYVTLSYTGSTGTPHTGVSNNIKVPVEDNYLFYSDTAYATDGSKFLATTSKSVSGNNVNSLAYATDDGDTAFTHANIGGTSIPSTAKTLMSNITMNLIASSSDATCGVAYSNGDIILAISGDIDDARANNQLIIDGKIIDEDVWGDAITMSDEYTAVLLEGGTITASQDSVYYYILSNDFGNYLGVGTHAVQIMTSKGIISTTIIVPNDSESDGEKVNSTDSYGTIVSITKNAAGETVYTYNNGTIRIAKYDSAGKATNTIITFSNGNVLIKNADGTSTLTGPDGSITTYDAGGKVVSIYKASNNVGGYSSSIVKNSDGSYSITVYGDWSKFSSLTIDNVALASSNYTTTTSTNTTVVTIKSSYINGLSTGTHSLKATFSDGSTSISFVTSTSDNGASSTATSLSSAIGSVSSGFTKTAVSDATLTATNTQMLAVTPSGKIATLLALSEIDLDSSKTVTKTTDGKYVVQFNVSSVVASDNILILHRLSSGTWEQIIPKTIGNGYVIAEFSSFSPVAIVKLTDSAATTKASATAIALDAKITAITNGFTHAALKNDANITDATNYMTSLKGKSSDVYSLATITDITKASGTIADSFYLTVTGISKDDTIQVIAQQLDGTWAKVTSTIMSDGKISMIMSSLPTGEVAVIKIAPAGSSSGSSGNTGGNSTSVSGNTVSGNSVSMTSAVTGQNPITMFITYFLSGIGLK